MKSQTSFVISVVVAVLMLLLVLYVGGYLLLHERNGALVLSDRVVYDAYYNINGRNSSELWGFFFPAYWIDRQLRPSYWEIKDFPWDEVEEIRSIVPDLPERPPPRDE